MRAGQLFNGKNGEYSSVITLVSPGHIVSARGASPQSLARSPASHSARQGEVLAASVLAAARGRYSLTFVDGWLPRGLWSLASAAR